MMWMCSCTQMYDMHVHMYTNVRHARASVNMLRHTPRLERRAYLGYGSPKCWCVMAAPLSYKADTLKPTCRVYDIYIYMYVYVYMEVYMYICIYMYVCMYIYMYM